MENIYKIKIRSNPDNRGLYPSERRYSASFVLGLAVLHLCLSCIGLMLGSISLTSHKSRELSNNISISEEIINLTSTDEKINVDLDEIKHSTVHEAYLNIFDSNLITNLFIGPCLMFIGGLSAGICGLLAWKRWYIDNNITWFFFMSIVSVITAFLCLIMVTIFFSTLYDKMIIIQSNVIDTKPKIRLIVAINIFLAAIFEFLWSILSTKVAYRGMKNAYPDDIMVSKGRGKIVVSTINKGNKKSSAFPPDILNHFPSNGKFAKYISKLETADNNGLPKAESNSEYQERVRQFLSSHMEDTISNKGK